MTEAEWLAVAYPSPILEHMRNETTPRKLRLVACGCTRRILRLMPDKRSHAALELAERLADGLATESEVRKGSEARLGIPHDHTGWALCLDAFTAAYEASASIARAVRMQRKPSKRAQAERDERREQAIIVRDIFGNPFRSVAFNPFWRTSTAMALASQMYESHDFFAMPILADALQDAGCDNTDVLDHCRGPGAHVRGCWVADLMLGKE